MTEKFEYLLNAMENAAAEKKPNEHDYYGKRRAVLNFVAELESGTRVDERAVADLVEKVRKLIEWMPHYPGASTGHSRRLAVEGAIERIESSQKLPVG